MTEQEILKIVTDYIGLHWKEIGGALLGVAITLVASTWFVAKAWYGREIKHLNNQISSLNQLHNERSQVLKDKADERTKYAKGLVEIAEQRVLAIEHEKTKLLDKISQYENELRTAEAIIARSKSFKHTAGHKKLVTRNKEEVIHEIEVLLSFSMFQTDGKGKVSPKITKLIHALSKESVTLSVVSTLVPVIGALVSFALQAIISREKSTQDLSKFHYSYYKSIKNILEPINSESSTITYKDAEKVIDYEIQSLKREKKPEE